MAQLGGIESDLGSLPSGIQVALRNIFRGILRQWRFGRPEDGTPSENFAAGFFAVTTDPTPGTEFSIAHNFGRAPYLAINVLDLQTVGYMAVPLEVSRVADARRIYLKSTVASAPIVLFVEA